MSDRDGTQKGETPVKVNRHRREKDAEGYCRQQVYSIVEQILSEDPKGIFEQETLHSDHKQAMREDQLIETPSPSKKTLDGLSSDQTEKCQKDAIDEKLLMNPESNVVERRLFEKGES